MLNRIIQLLLISIFSISLFACATPEPKVFGVPQGEWNKMSKEQQDKVVKENKDESQTKKEDEELSGLFDAAKDAAD